MEKEKLRELIDGIFPSAEATVTQLRHEEDEALYQVWRIDAHERHYILKEAKGREAQLYPSVLMQLQVSVPKLYRMIEAEGKTYLLLEYIKGEDLCRCDRARLTLALDALISLQNKTWESRTVDPDGQFFEKSLLQRRERGEYLKNPLLEEAYEKFLGVYSGLPRTLCHDDLLPFNIIASDREAFLIDWECAGSLPYPTSFARLIAHTGETADALFYMSEADKAFAVEYYYDCLLRDKGIRYEDWRDALEYFLFYEYCEWVFVGNKYHTTDGQYFKKYLPLAKRQAQKILGI